MKKILLIRTDRIGDVVLTTPCIEILRTHFPEAHLAMMVQPKTYEIVCDHPHLNEVLVYDKYGENRSWPSSLKFSQHLKQKHFDVAIVLNPSFRNHFLTYLARIPMRIGYHSRKKGSFFLTHTLKNLKGEGKKSEAFYNEDLLQFLEIPPRHSRKLYFHVPIAAQAFVDTLLIKNSIGGPFAVLNVSASSPSKIWPAPSFASLAHWFLTKKKMPIILIGNPDTCNRVSQFLSLPHLNLAETLNLKQLGALLQKTTVFISADTGPVHMAAALGTPTLVIFGRTLAGLGPERWAPLSEKTMTLQKNIGCTPCLADHCQINFDCLKAMNVESVIHAIQQLS
ncbi:MAG: glycosyltransferase family 9 protein [Deltaproteobacteria bacterium]|nr:glycosyltransferase family 9 protein [Deltaproteobacteria bacterium]